MKWTPQSLFTTILGGRVTIEGISFRIHHSSKLNSNKFLYLVHPQRRYLGGNHNFNLGHLEIDFQYGIRLIRSYVRTTHFQNPHQSTFVTMTTLETKKSWDNYNMIIAECVCESVIMTILETM